MSYAGRRSPSPGPIYNVNRPHHPGDPHSPPMRRRYNSRSPSPGYTRSPYDHNEDPWARSQYWRESHGSRWDPNHPPAVQSNVYPSEWGRRRSPSSDRGRWDGWGGSASDDRHFRPSTSWRESQGDPHMPYPEPPSAHSIFDADGRYRGVSPVRMPMAEQWTRPQRMNEHVDDYRDRHFAPPLPPLRRDPLPISHPPHSYDGSPPQPSSSARITHRPSAMGSYKLQERQASHAHPPLRPPHAADGSAPYRESPVRYRPQHIDTAANGRSVWNRPGPPSPVTDRSSWGSRKFQPPPLNSFRSKRSASPFFKTNDANRNSSSNPVHVGSSIASSDNENDSDVASSRPSSPSSQVSQSRRPPAIQDAGITAKNEMVERESKDSLASEVTKHGLISPKLEEPEVIIIPPDNVRSVTQPPSAVAEILVDDHQSVEQTPNHSTLLTSPDMRKSLRVNIPGQRTTDPVPERRSPRDEIGTGMSNGPSAGPSRSISPDTEPEMRQQQVDAVETSRRTSPLVRDLTNAAGISLEDQDSHAHPRMDSNSMTEALKKAITARRKYDQQTRSQRVNPILIANLSIAAESEQPSEPVRDIVGDVLRRTSTTAKMETQTELRAVLAERFAERQATLSEKTQKLREEYMALHEKWLANCTQIDGALRAGVMEEAAATTGRTTRRSAANLGDAVRSDLEMEQIIASLGNEELTDPNHLATRNVAVIPDMISVEKGCVEYIFDDTNGLVEDPDSLYDCRSGFYDWTPLEEDIFYNKYAEYPKQFGIISSFLPYKTTAQCVLYYYLHKKRLINFRNAANAPGKRRKGPRNSGRQKGNALLADIQDRDKEKPPSRRGRRPNDYAKGRRGALPADDGSRPKRRRTNGKARDVDGDDGDPESNCEPPKRKGGRPRKQKPPESPIPSPGPAETRFIDVNESLGRRRLPTATTYWSVADKEEFLRLLGRHGKNFKRIAASMPNKTTIQVSNYYKSHITALDLEGVAASARSRSPSQDRLGVDSFMNGQTPSMSAAASTTSGPQDADTAVEGDTDTIPLTLAKEDMESSFVLNGDQTPAHEKQIWFAEEFSSSLEDRAPVKGFMSVLNPSSFRMESPQPVPPPIPPFVHHVPNAIQTPLLVPSAFQFSAYNPPSYSSFQTQSPTMFAVDGRPSLSGKPLSGRKDSSFSFVPQAFSEERPTSMDSSSLHSGALTPPLISDRSPRGHGLFNGLLVMDDVKKVMDVTSK